MAIKKVSKIEICGLKDQQDEIISLLQTEGIFPPLISPDSDEQSELREKLNQIEFSHKFLKPFYTEKKSFFSSKKKYTKKEIDELLVNFEIPAFAANIQKAEAQQNEMNNLVNKNNQFISQLRFWQNIDLVKQSELKTCQRFIGSIKTSQWELFQDKLKEISELLHVETLFQDNITTQFILVYMNELSSPIEKLLREFETKKPELPPLSGSVRETIDKLGQENDHYNEELKGLEKQINQFAQAVPQLEALYDIISWKIAREELVLNSASSQYAFSITGWCNEEFIDQLKKDLSKISSATSVQKLDITESDDIPVLLNNNSLFEPYEFITHMYGSPKYNEVDPSPFLGIFFIIFFGLCLTDAGYGILLVVSMLAALKILKPPREQAKFFKTLLWGGVLTVIAGALFGGWFGITLDNLPDSSIKNALLSIRLIDPLNEPLKVLIVSMALGVLQVLTGITIGMVHKFQQKKFFEGVVDYGFWIGLISSILLFYLSSSGIIGAGLMEIFKWSSIGFAIGLVATQGRDKKNPILKLFSGILSLYGLVGYGSDVLSYSRILALGLATAVIAMVVNTMADLLGGMVPYVGWLIALIIYVVGHLFNIAINALGAYIHSMRLQFVEFFPKFMEGGGLVFKPFKRKSTYIEYNDEQ